jgi:DNA replication protein DnaC
MIHHTIEKLLAMNLPGCVAAIKQQEEQQGLYRELPFEERLALIVDSEFLRRTNASHQKRRKSAGIRTDAAVENIDFSLKRNLTKADILKFAEGAWIQDKKNLIITGQTGVGKTFIASALADKVCRNQMNALVIKVQDLVANLMVARADGSFGLLKKKLAKIHLLVIDEWMREKIPTPQARELLDLFDDRYQTRSIALVSQVPVKDWFDRFDDPTIADALLDRVVHNSYRIELNGDSVRKMMRQ